MGFVFFSSGHPSGKRSYLIFKILSNLLYYRIFIDYHVLCFHLSGRQRGREGWKEGIEEKATGREEDREINCFFFFNLLIHCPNKCHRHPGLSQSEAKILVLHPSTRDVTCCIPGCVSWDFSWHCSVGCVCPKRWLSLLYYGAQPRVLMFQYYSSSYPSRVWICTHALGYFSWLKLYIQIYTSVSLFLVLPECDVGMCLLPHYLK